MDFRAKIESYIPFDESEEKNKEIILKYNERGKFDGKREKEWCVWNRKIERK